LEKFHRDCGQLENAIDQLKEGNENLTTTLITVYTKTGQFPVRLNQTIFSDNKTYIYWFYYSTCGCRIIPTEKEYAERLPLWVSNISGEDFESHLLNTARDGYEVAREVLSVIGLPESEITSHQLNYIVPLNNLEGFIFSEDDSDNTVRAAVTYLVEGSFALMQDSSNQNFNPIDHGDQSLDSSSFSSVFALIVVSGLLDGVNPCAFAVLLFFTAFLFITSRTSLEQTKRRLLLVGLIYITGVYLAYLMVGLGIIKVITITPFPHLVAKIGGLLVILLGAINIKDYFWPGRGFSLSMSMSQWKTVRNWMRKSTVLSSFVMGLLVSFFEFPCTGGIYVAILGMLAQKTTFTQGFVYLLIYNVAFVLPLIILLVFVSRRKVMEFSLEKWQRGRGKGMRLLLGLVMVALGVFLLFYGFV
jgi:cytochrome c biogenesis protein CcdA